MTALTDVSGIGPSAAQALEATGISSAEELAIASVDAISEAEGFGPAKAEKAKTAAQELVGDTAAEETASQIAAADAQDVSTNEPDTSQQALMAAAMANASPGETSEETVTSRHRKKEKNKRKAQSAARRKNRKPKKKRR